MAKKKESVKPTRKADIENLGHVSPKTSPKKLNRKVKSKVTEEMKEKKPEKFIFVKGPNPTIFWDAKNNRVLAEFVDGIFTTTDERVASILKDYGYKQKKDYPYGPPEGGFKEIPSPGATGRHVGLNLGGEGPELQPDLEVEED